MYFSPNFADGEDGIKSRLKRVPQFLLMSLLHAYITTASFFLFSFLDLDNFYTASLKY